MEPAQDGPNRNIIRVIYPFHALAEATPCPFSWLAALKAGYWAAGAGSEDAENRAAGRLPFWNPFRCGFEIAQFGVNGL
jgi:hypothetical protein